MTANRINLLLELATWPFRKCYYGMRLRNKRFSIVSSNCIGTKIYKEACLPYGTPFVGLFIHPPCYLELLRHLEVYLAMPIRFAAGSRYQSRYPEQIRYPVGILGDGVEIHFVHYRDEAEARAKWERRMRRMNFGNLFVTFTDRDGCDQRMLEEFDAMPFAHKVCFTAGNHPRLKSAVWLPEYRGGTEVGDLFNEFHVLKRHFDFCAWLNSGGRAP